MPKGKDSRLQLKVIKEVYDQPAVGYLDTEKTLNILRQHYYWLGMRAEVEQYI